jgi:GrpB-like predicted nucleotidyltransferase (UPF0157 family)
MQTRTPTPDAELNRVLHALAQKTRAILGDNLVGLYLQGSFAAGDWDAYSDVDWLAIVTQPLSEVEVAALQAMHRALYALDCPWAQHLEGSYMPLAMLRRMDPAHEPLWYLDNGSQELIFSDHCNTLVVRWQVREQGVALIGPPATELVEPVPVEALRQEVLDTMRDWAATFLDTPQVIANRWYQPFVVLSYCRMLHTLATGRIHSKPAGARWGNSNLHPRWSGLIRRAWDERPDPWRKVWQPADPQEVQITLAFVRYAIALAEQGDLAEGTEPWVTLVQRYDPAWPRWFEEIRAYLEPGLAGLGCRIEHTGSTSIPGMTAKPIIDLIIVIPPETFEQVRERLAALGYRHRGDLGIAGREAFELLDARALLALPAQHMYVCQEGAYELRKQVAFRDFLRAHPAWRERLSSLKWELCLQHGNDRQAYMDGKDALVREITALALKAAEDAQR